MLCTFTQQWIENHSINSLVDKLLRESLPFDFWQFYPEYLCFGTEKAMKSDEESSKGFSIETVRRRMSQALSFMKQRYQVRLSSSDVKNSGQYYMSPTFKSRTVYKALNSRHGPTSTPARPSFKMVYLATVMFSKCSRTFADEHATSHVSLHCSEAWRNRLLAWI